MNPRTLEVRKRKYKDCICVDIRQMDRNEGDQPVIGLKQVIWSKDKGLLQYSLKNGVSYTLKDQYNLQKSKINPVFNPSFQRIKNYVYR